MTLFNPPEVTVSSGGVGGNCYNITVCPEDPTKPPNQGGCRGSALIKPTCTSKPLLEFDPNSNDFKADVYFQEPDVAGEDSYIQEVNVFVPPETYLSINRDYFSLSDWVEYNPNPGAPMAKAVLTFDAATYNSDRAFKRCRLTWAILNSHDVVLTIRWPDYGESGLRDNLIVRFPSECL